MRLYRDQSCSRLNRSIKRTKDAAEAALHELKHVVDSDTSWALPHRLVPGHRRTAGTLTIGNINATATVSSHAFKKSCASRLGLSSPFLPCCSGISCFFPCSALLWSTVVTRLNLSHGKTLNSLPYCQLACVCFIGFQHRFGILQPGFSLTHACHRVWTKVSLTIYSRSIKMVL